MTKKLADLHKKFIVAPEKFPVCTMYADVSELFRHARNFTDRGTSFVLVEYPREWGNRAAMQATRRGVVVQIKNSVTDKR